MLHDRPNILCVHQGHELYGSDRVFIQSVKAFRQAWPQAFITIHLPKSGMLSQVLLPYADKMIVGDLFVLRRKEWRLNSLFLLFKNTIYCFRKSKEQNIIYISTMVILPYLLIGPFLKIRPILHIHEITMGFEKFYLWLILKWSKVHVLVNSKATGSSVKSVPFTVIYNGIAEPKDTTEIKSKSQLNLLLIGRINFWKGHDLAIEALSLLKGKNIALRFVGSSYYNTKDKQYLVDKIKKHGLSERVQFFEFDPDPAQHYQWTDIVLVPSTRPEPFGLVAVEAMSHARPVIAANHGGLPEIVMHAETGALFEPCSAKALADAIKTYIDTPNLLTAHGKQGHIRYLASFQEHHYIDGFIAELKTLHG